jgi:hypothetical protein
MHGNPPLGTHRMIVSNGQHALDPSLPIILTVSSKFYDRVLLDFQLLSDDRMFSYLPLAILGGYDPSRTCSSLTLMAFISP